MTRTIAWLSLPLVLLGCDSPDRENSLETPFGETGPEATGTSADTMGNNPPPAEADECTIVIDDDVSIPTTWTNGPSNCDYLIEGYIEITSRLDIEPGVVIRASADASIVIDGGELYALGTADERIVFGGLSPVPGYWSGLQVYDARDVQLDYVDIQDGGQVCNLTWCPEAGLIISDTTASITNSSVSNSYSTGLLLDAGTALEAFSNNRFYGNDWAGLVILSDLAGMLDTESDYLGQDDPNGTPYVLISGTQDSQDVRWKKLNAPYYISGPFEVEGTVLAIDPGVEVVFGDDAVLRVEWGLLDAVGTAVDPIVFRGADDRAGYWYGIEIQESNGNRLDHVEIHGAGGDGLSAKYAALYVTEGSVSVSNTLISASAADGIGCNDGGWFLDPAIVQVGPGNVFQDVAYEDIESECVIE